MFNELFSMHAIHDSFPYRGSVIVSAVNANVFAKKHIFYCRSKRSTVRVVLACAKSKKKNVRKYQQPFAGFWRKLLSFRQFKVDFFMYSYGRQAEKTYISEIVVFRSMTSFWGMRIRHFTMIAKACGERPNKTNPNQALVTLQIFFYPTDDIYTVILLEQYYEIHRQCHFFRKKIYALSPLYVTVRMYRPKITFSTECTRLCGYNVYGDQRKESTAGGLPRINTIMTMSNDVMFKINENLGE